MLGMGGGATGSSDLDAKRQAIIMGGVTGAIEPQLMSSLLAEIDRQTEVAKEEKGKIKVTEGKISQTKDILAILQPIHDQDLYRLVVMLNWREFVKTHVILTPSALMVGGSSS